MLVLNLMAFLFLFLYSVCSFLLISLSIKVAACSSTIPPTPSAKLGFFGIWACSDPGVKEGGQICQLMGTGTPR